MRLGIAATLLACHALPVSSTIDDKKPLLSSAGKLDVDAKKTLLSTIAAGGKRQRKHTPNTRRKLMKGRSSAGKSNPLLNTDRRNRKTKDLTECDPTALDMGILECGSGNYCVESESSFKGGICSSTKRRVQEECSGTNPCTTDGTFCNLEDGMSGECEPCPCADAAYGCLELELENEAGTSGCLANCGQYYNLTTCQPIDDGDDDDYFECESTVDPDTGSGIYSCYGIAPECSDPASSCCFAFGYTGYYSGGNYTNGTSLIGGVTAYYFTEPYEQNVSVAFTVGSPDCEIVFNGVTCNSCTIMNDCYYFDCTNAPSGQAGDTCGDGGYYTLLPVQQFCAVTYPPDAPCFLCGYGSLANPNATIGGYSCYELYIGTYFLGNNTDECTEAQNYIGPICCFSSGPYESCNICGDMGMLMYPDDEISPDLTCQDLYDFGNLGFISEADCTNTTYYAAPFCCEAQTGPEPADPCLLCPGDAPVTNPDNLVQTPGQPDISCGQLQEFGRQGLIPADLCAATQVAIPALCGCDDIMTEPVTDPPAGDPSEMPASAAPSEMTGASEPPATDAPVTPAPVTPAPVTPAPITPSPVDTPTEPPVAPPPTPPPTDPPGSSSFYVSSAVSVMGISLALVAYMTAA